MAPEPHMNSSFEFVIGAGARVGAVILASARFGEGDFE